MSHTFKQMPDNKLILMSAPNGARRLKGDHSALPVSPKELAECAKGIVQAGGSVLHLHVRDSDGHHSLNPLHYNEAIQRIKLSVADELILQITTEAVGIYSIDEQVYCVKEVRPEAVSIALREICPDESSLVKAEGFFSWCAQEAIWVQIILYSLDDIHRYKELKQRGVLSGLVPSVLFVLGRYSQNLLGDPNDLLGYYNALGNDVQWACCCFGQTELAAMAIAAELGGHVRIGFENNLWLPDGTRAHDNIELLNHFVGSCLPGNRTLATADDIRQWLHANQTSVGSS
ncbi:3-keto-5-aminohexanoate cleavage protein [Alkalimonas sp. MEB108]|uniref:3-keto-5-aminohexanoate cleavage protein n=1 Tax=Alkalimonas cellulosilytica TaxID=3058395 RepID=A0ABU7J8L3_9GAMM|nr:3-keto-5-aminohexanoate cleavage protein [Alkalimonas sp. MEB108]MEE2002891.1 3-keto-5-aminohexanoate cleavage protein [Alkalimonas sp. MEB108]